MIIFSLLSIPFLSVRRFLFFIVMSFADSRPKALNKTSIYVFIRVVLGMVTKEELLMTKHAQDEAMDDGISKTEIAEAISRGPRVPESNHFVTVYRHFTVVSEKISDNLYKVITVHLGRPRGWKIK